MRRLMMYGERAGVREFLTVVPPLPAVQGLLLRHSFTVVAPVYLFQLKPESAGRLASVLSSLLPGKDVTAELLGRRGQADLDRIDRFTRNITREVDHEYWLKQRGFGAAFVRQGSRIAAYAYGGTGQVLSLIHISDRMHCRDRMWPAAKPTVSSPSMAVKNPSGSCRMRCWRSGSTSMSRSRTRGP